MLKKSVTSVTSSQGFSLSSMFFSDDEHESFFSSNVSEQNKDVSEVLCQPDDILCSSSEDAELMSDVSFHLLLEEPDDYLEFDDILNVCDEDVADDTSNVLDSPDVALRLRFANCIPWIQSI